jgi:hypothetical protein
MGNICPEEELDDHTWEFLLSACEEDEDSDMSQRKCAKTRESTEQSSAIDIGSMNPAMASVVCGGGARSETQPHVEQQVIGSSRHGGGHGGTAGAAVEPGLKERKLSRVRRVRSTAQGSPKNGGMLARDVWTSSTT